MEKLSFFKINADYYLKFRFSKSRSSGIAVFVFCPLLTKTIICIGKIERRFATRALRTKICKSCLSQAFTKRFHELQASILNRVYFSYTFKVDQKLKYSSLF